MALQSSGAISISEINAEVTAINSNSLTDLSTSVGKTAPHAMSEFYGYGSAVTVNINAFVPSNMGCYNNYTFAAATESSVAVNTNLGVNVYWYGDLGGYVAGYFTINSGNYCGSVGIYTGSGINCVGEYISNIYWDITPSSSGGQNYFPFNYYTDLYPC